MPESPLDAAQLSILYHRHPKWPADAAFEEAESDTWTILKPCDWNEEVHLG